MLDKLEKVTQLCVDLHKSQALKSSEGAAAVGAMPGPSIDLAQVMLRAPIPGCPSVACL
eukprot:CAMPEP_0113718032 /NCGR_PEP_ID=MMETSP0038_2-20120614/34934_1 /TAXON_ID=2898 /ORGANISM="Cryptomonas paramecium" /LENGTH=58 /DNA_ID=CAMNT_0000646049 /DNA_START=143 /DNA_END=317 /DNA_ORIENTATION=- /assembly_acc=CAM_ASM_000170